MRKMAENKDKKTKSKKPTVKKEVREIFNIEKAGEEVIKETKGEEEVKEVKKGQIEHQNKILRNVLILGGFVVIGVIIGYFFIYMSTNFEHKGIAYNIVDTEQVRFYHTQFPLFVKGKEINYHVYLRKDPRENVRIPFEGNFAFDDDIVLNSTSGFNCDGKGVIATANMNQILIALGAEVINDPEAVCDPDGRYLHINLEEGEESKIEQYGPRCYKFKINNCEIIDVTERYLTEVIERI
jgi:hypothetical protein